MNEPFINACKYLAKKQPTRYAFHMQRLDDRVIYSCTCKLHGLIGVYVLRLGIG